MSVFASQIASLTMSYSTVYSGADQRKHQSSASLASGEFPHKRPVTRIFFPFDDAIMKYHWYVAIEVISFDVDTPIFKWEMDAIERKSVALDQ